MSADNIRISTILPSDLLEEIGRYQTEHHLSTRSEAIRVLLSTSVYDRKNSQETSA